MSLQIKMKNIYYVRKVKKGNWTKRKETKYKTEIKLRKEKSLTNNNNDDKTVGRSTIDREGLGRCFDARKPNIESRWKPD